MFRGWSSSNTGTSGSRRRCSRTSRTIWRWTHTSRAQTPGSGLNSGMWDHDNNNGKHILCVCSTLFDLCPVHLSSHVQLVQASLNLKFYSESSLNLRYHPFLQSILRYSLVRMILKNDGWLIMTSGTHCHTDGRWLGRRKTCSGARESTRWICNYSNFKFAFRGKFVDHTILSMKYYF